MTVHAVKWTAPSPLWKDLLTDQAGGTMHFVKPGILRFADDAFMDHYLAVLERSPAHIGDFIATPETWKEPSPIPEALSLIKPLDQESKLARKMKRMRVAEDRFSSHRMLSPASFDPAKPLKLFHPAHQRFYLVTAALVCGPNGLTDHKIDSAHQERVGFVVRRLFPQGPVDPKQDLTASDPAGWDEYALIHTAGNQAWQRVDGTPEQDQRILLTGEELLPLFPVHYTDDDERKRRILSGVIPVGKREAYMGATRSAAAVEGGTAPGPASRPKAARMVLFRTQVAEPWKSAVEQAYRTSGILRESLSSDKPPEPWKIDALLKASHEQIQTMSWYILLDFAKYLGKYLPTLMGVINGETGENKLSSNQVKLLRAMEEIKVPAKLVQELARNISGEKGNIIVSGFSASSFPDSLKTALSKIVDYEDSLDAAIMSYDRTESGGWPPFLFPIAGVTVSNEIAAAGETSLVVLTGKSSEDDLQKKRILDSIDKFVALVTRALPTDADPKTPPPPLPLAAQKPFDHREGWFVIRCVYERRNCGPLHPAVVSEATEPFQMAGFFDPDAPARPIRIPLPIDTSPAGLRKFDKNTAFMISDMLCGQMKRAKGLSFGDLVLSVLPWPFHKDLPVPEAGPCESAGQRFGMICSLSIPIITICALILLTIIVSLLDIIFRWIPYFIICFPLPGFKAKKPGGAGP